MTDNGSCYRSRAFARACKRLRIKHIRTKPYTPQTNGKAERFIQTALREWAYATAFQNSDQRPPSSPIGCIATIGIAHMLASQTANQPPRSDREQPLGVACLAGAVDAV